MPRGASPSKTSDVRTVSGQEVQCPPTGMQRSSSHPNVKGHRIILLPLGAPQMFPDAPPLFPGAPLPCPGAHPAATLFPRGESSLCSAQLAGSLEASLQWDCPRSSTHHSRQGYQPPFRSNHVCRSSAAGRRRNRAKAWRRRSGRRAGVKEVSRRRRYPCPHGLSTKSHFCCRMVICCQVRSRR